MSPGDLPAKHFSQDNKTGSEIGGYPMKGFYERILIVDLNGQKSSIASLPDDISRKYLGGKGLGTYLLSRHNPEGIDPMDPENCLIFATGPITGSSIWGSCRYGVFTKSPQTGFYSEAYSGGKTPEAIDATGFDAIIVRGRCEKPAVLEITPEGAAFHDASDLWGMDTFNTEDEVVRRFARSEDMKRGAVVIGPAAENLVRFSVIENDYWRSAGRTGPGTVMGSKRVKAIMFRGNRSRPIADVDGVRAFAKEIAQSAKSDPAVIAYKTKGTPMMVEICNQFQSFPSRYWSEGSVEHWENISSEALHTRCDVKPRACLKCLMACGRMTRVQQGRHRGLQIEGPEYETIYAFGGLCMVDSIEEIAYLNDICDRLGMDTMTAGNLCAFTIEAVKHGRIQHAIDYGDVDAIAELLEMIARRSGIGDVLAEGILHAAREWNMEERAVHVKGLEPAGYDPRVFKGMALAYAVADRGACHLRSTFYKPEISGTIPPDQIEEKAALFLDFEDRLTLLDTLILCRFYRDMYQWEELSKIITLTTGIEENKESLKQKATNVTDLVRRFNIREGLKAEDDELPKWFYRHALKGGHQLTEDEFKRLRDDYYRLRKWDRTGRPKDLP
jgi:aldehyde:ferredoxin oxidoreductase